MAMGKMYRSKRIQKVQVVKKSTRRRGRTDKLTNLYTYKQVVPLGPITNATLLDSGYAWSFKLNDCDQSATFTSLYDQYRINSVTIRLIPRASISGLPGAVVGGTPGFMLGAVDYDDSIAPVTLSDLRQYGNCRTLSIAMGKTHTIKIRPHLAVAAFGGGVFSSYLNSKAQWLDVASPAVVHYGYKLVIPTASVAGSVYFDAVADYNISFRNSR